MIHHGAGHPSPPFSSRPNHDAGPAQKSVSAAAHRETLPGFSEASRYGGLKGRSSHLPSGGRDPVLRPSGGHSVAAVLPVALGRSAPLVAQRLPVGPRTPGEEIREKGAGAQRRRASHGKHHTPCIASSTLIWSWGKPGRRWIGRPAFRVMQAQPSISNQR